jgi:hypothetical protein
MKIEPVDYLCVRICQRDMFNSSRGLTEGSVPTPPWFHVELAPVRVNRPFTGNDDSSEGELVLEGQIIGINVKGSPGFFVVGRRYNLTIEEKR